MGGDTIGAAGTAAMAGADRKGFSHHASKPSTNPAAIADNP